MERGFFKREGPDMAHDLRSSANRTYKDMRDGHVDMGILAAAVPYEQVVATRFSHLWAG